MGKDDKCKQGGCSDFAGLHDSIKSLVDGMEEMRGHLIDYEDNFKDHVKKFESHMDNEEKFAAELTASIESLTAEVKNLKTKDATDDAKKEGVFKTIRAILVGLTVFGAVVGFIWQATGASITFGG